MSTEAVGSQAATAGHHLGLPPQLTKPQGPPTASDARSSKTSNSVNGTAAPTMPGPAPKGTHQRFVFTDPVAFRSVIPTDLGGGS